MFRKICLITYPKSAAICYLLYSKLSVTQLCRVISLDKNEPRSDWGNSPVKLRKKGQSSAFEQQKCFSTKMLRKICSTTYPKSVAICYVLLSKLSVTQLCRVIYIEKKTKSDWGNSPVELRKKCQTLAFEQQKCFSNKMLRKICLITYPKSATICYLLYSKLSVTQLCRVISLDKKRN